MILAAGLDDAFFKLFSDPNAFGAVAIVLFIYTFIIVLILRYASSSNKSLTDIYKDDNKSNNNVLAKLVEMASDFADTAKQVITAVENNTKAFTSFKESTEVLTTSVDKLGNKLETVQSDLITKIDDLASRMSNVETKDKEIYDLVLSIKEIINTYFKDVADGTSINKNTDPVGSGCEVLGIEPRHFNSVVSDYGVEDRSTCDDIWFQYDWQNAGKFSREDLAMVLHQAETATANLLGYYPVPAWIRQEEHEIVPSYMTGMYNVYTSDWRNQSVFSQYGYVIEGGIRAKDLIQANVAIVYSDDDLDGYSETATVTVVTTVTDKEEILVYFPNKSGNDSWEIRPVDVSIGAGTATITFPKEYAVLPVLQEKVPSPADPQLEVDGDDVANFALVVDVYHVYNDPSQQVVFYSEDLSSCTPATVTGCLSVRDGKRGIFSYRFATWDTNEETWDTSTCSSLPTRMEIYYRAGLRNYNSDYPNLRMDETLERLIIYYALTLSDKPICGCNDFQVSVSQLNVDLARIGDKVSYQNTPERLNCPLGTKKAAIDLWQHIKRIKLGEALRKGH